jgi:hypothetical protein
VVPAFTHLPPCKNDLYGDVAAASTKERALKWRMRRRPASMSRNALVHPRLTVAESEGCFYLPSSGTRVRRARKVVQKRRLAAPSSRAGARAGSLSPRVPFVQANHEPSGASENAIFTSG